MLPPTPNPAIVEILRSAADRIETDGWLQNSYWNANTGACCALGALRLASGYSMTKAHTLESAHKFMAATEYLKDYLHSTKYSETDANRPPSIAMWNDHDSRVAHDVIELMRSAANKLEKNNDPKI